MIHAIYFMVVKRDAINAILGIPIIVYHAMQAIIESISSMKQILSISVASTKLHVKELPHINIIHHLELEVCQLMAYA
jgi:hypothetical protein